MIRKEEILNPESCLNRADPDEPLFVLRAHDITAPDVVRFWAQERLRIGKNESHDEQIREAFALAERMEQWKAQEGLPRDAHGLLEKRG